MFDDNQRMKLWRYPCCCQQLDHFAETKWRWMSSVHIHSGSQILISWSGHASNYQVIKAMCSQLVDHDSPGFAFPTFITTLWLIKKTLHIFHLTPIILVHVGCLSHVVSQGIFFSCHESVCVLLSDQDDPLPGRKTSETYFQWDS